MLTEDEKNKIKAEEIFRAEIQASLKPKKEGGLMGFLNSGLGIWFLSTIVIGLFTYFFNEYKENKKVDSERDIKIKQLDLEIENRISQFWVHLDPLVNQADTALPLKAGVPQDTIRLLWEAFKNPPSLNPKIATAIYKEYETRTTISLMIELSSLLGEKYEISTKTEKIDSDSAHPIVIVPMKNDEAKKYNEMRQIETGAVFIASNGIFLKSNHPSIKEIWQMFSDSIIIRRWDYLFPYTDCLFC